MSVVVIRVDGTNVTPDVIYASAEFTSQVNGQAGPCHFKVKDLAHNHSFTTGQTVTLDIDGTRVWGGFLTRAQPGWGFAVDITTTPQITERIWSLEGVDYNILFQKRFIHNKAHPTTKIPNYAVGTPDRTIILDLVANYLDLEGDGLTTGGVVHVGTPNPDKAGSVADAGQTWGQVMALVGRDVGAIFYISPDKVITYVDVDVANATFNLSDTPTGALVGYADMEILNNGSTLINDALVWGAGTGSIGGRVTFARVQDAASIAAHGRWQSGEFTTALYKQESVTKRANTTVYGSPQNKRGGKDDAIAITCTIYDPGLVAGQKVIFTNNVFGYTDTIPLRRMVITFAGPTSPVFLLNLSHAIDPPWGSYEFWFPPFHLPPFPRPPVIPGVVIPDPPVSGCACGITDTFDRTVATGWGTSDAGIAYNNNVSLPRFSVNGAEALITFAGTSSTSESTALIFGRDLNEVEARWMMKFSSFAPVANGDRAIINCGGVSIDFGRRQVTGNRSDTVVRLTSAVGDTHATHGLTLTNWFHVRLTGGAPGTSRSLYVWQDGATEPSTPLITIATNSTAVFSRWQIQISKDAGFAAFTTYFDNLDITGLDRCSDFQRFDDFNRTVARGYASSWGATPAGYQWQNYDQPAVFVENGAGVLMLDPDDPDGFASIAGAMLIEPSLTFLNVGQTITMSARFKFNRVPVTGERTIETSFELWNGRAIITMIVSSEVDTGGIYLRNTWLDKTDWLADTWYTMTWQQGPSSGRAKIWTDAEGEPSGWTIEDGTAVTLATQTHVVIRLDGSPSEGLLRMDVDWIDFGEYQGPCYRVCDPTLGDTFSRTIPSTGNWGNDDWGTADSGHVWGLGGAAGSSTGGSSASVNGSEGILRFGAPPVDTEYALNSYISDTQAWVGDIDIEGSFKFERGPTVMSTDFVGVDLYIDNLDIGGTIFGAGTIRHADSMICQLRWSATSSETLLSVSIDHPVGDFVVFSSSIPLTLAIETWYRIRWQISGTTTRARIWTVGSVEPSAWDVSDTMLNRSFGETNSFHIQYEMAGHPALSSALSVDDLVYGGCPGVSPGVGVDSPATASSCHGFTGNGVQTDFVFPVVPFVPGTSRVYIDGSLQHQDLQYTELSEFGTIQFGVAPSPTAHIMFCANAAVA